MFTIHQSNRLEELLLQLSMLLRQPLTDPLSPETVIVQSQGMARWLSLNLAEIHGVCANLDCPFPAAFIWRLLIGQGSGENLNGSMQEVEIRPYEPGVLVWSVMESLGRLQDDSAFAEIQKYISREPKDTRKYQLSLRVAALLDQYTVHRPEWIKNWSLGKQVKGLGAPQEWQAILWEDIMEKHGASHRVSLFEQFKENQHGNILASLPERLCLFGIPAMPKSQLEFFTYVSGLTDVHLFLLSPCQHYWADYASEKSLAREEVKGTGLDCSNDLHFDKGCQLLVSMGQMGRDFQNLLLSSAQYSEREFYVEPGMENILSVIQSDVLAGQDICEQFDIDPDDNSVQIHKTHSPMREVEVLHDQLLDIFTKDEKLEARDVLVMVPDIALYAPFIDAIFGSIPGEKSRIPYSIADRSATGPIINAFFDLLHLCHSRVNASQVLSLLGQEPVRSRFNINAGQMDTVRKWVKDTGIRWGLSPEHRQNFGGADLQTGTWSMGMDRMMLGYAIPDDDTVIFDAYLPYGDIEGSQGSLLGKFVNFFSTLEAFVASCKKKKSMKKWRDNLTKALIDFFDEKKSSGSEVQKIRGKIEKLVNAAEAAQNFEEIGLDVVMASLEASVKATSGRNFLCGRVTFCQMVPMRSIPFKIICLLGMNDNTFPRQERPVSFDLMTGNRQAGDRSRRDDDRYLFLETILSARQCLYISYVGLSNHDQRDIPPSVVVSELLEHISGRLGISMQECSDYLVVEHALQPFSRKYFAGELFSYSSLNRIISENLGKNHLSYGLLGQNQKIAAEDVPPCEIDLDNLLSFFEHPVRYLLRRRLGVFLDDYYSAHEDRDVFSLDSLPRYKLHDDLLNMDGDSLDPAIEYRIRTLQGELPAGLAGRYAFDDSLSYVSEVAENISKLRGAGKAGSFAVDLNLDGIRFTGRLDEIWEQGQFIQRPTVLSRFSYRDMIQTWLKHLVLCAADADIRSTSFLCCDGGKHFAFFEDATAELGKLVRLFIAGQDKALPIFPKTSFAYAKALWGGARQKSTPEQAIEKARHVWLTGDHFNSAEQEDAYLAAAFGDFDPLETSGTLGFETVAETVLATAFQWGKPIKYK